MLKDVDPTVSSEPRDLTFTVTSKQRQQLHAWCEAHYQTCPVAPDSFGGLLTYQFTPCGIGDGLRVVCPCGDKVDLTDVDTW